MRQIGLLAALSLLLATALFPAPAVAGTNRTYVSSKGDDANPCTQVSPCRTFQVAHDNANSGGEIMVIDGAGYGPVNVTKAITIAAEGIGEAGMLASGITINAGASDIVSLRGLTLNGVGASNYGIELISGGSLSIQNCFIHGYTITGIYVHPNTSTEVILKVSDTIVSNNTIYGIGVQPATGSQGFMNVVLKHVESSGNGSGMRFSARTFGDAFHVTITDSLVSNNKSVGITADASGETAGVTITNSQVLQSATGFFGNGSSLTMTIGGNTVSGNGTAYGVASGAVLNSFGNNYINNNGSNGAGVAVVPMQ